MKIVFLDIDGVLNGYNFFNVLGWRIVCLFQNKCLRNWYRRITNPCGVHESKVKRLAKIIKETNAKVVLTSTWRHYFWNVPYEEQDGRQKQLTDLFNKYDIDVIDITPSIPDKKRDSEIISWLAKYKDEVEKFIILDDEKSLIRAFEDDECFIETVTFPFNGKIKLNVQAYLGITRKHVKKAILYFNN